MDQNIYFVGMMGSGKSAIARSLSKRLGCKHVDIDNLIEKAEGHSINQIFKEKGEPYFRDLETETLKSISKETGLLVATGGGIVLRDENLELMKNSGVTVYLKQSPEVLLSHIEGKKRTRPLLQVENPLEKLRELLEERKEQYEKADYCFEVQGEAINEIISGVIRLLEKENIIEAS